MAAPEYLTKLAENHCEENYFSSSFSHKFLRKCFLVLAATFLKITPLQVFGSFCLSLNMSETYLEPSQTYKMEPFPKIVNSSRGVFRTESNIEDVAFWVK